MRYKQPPPLTVAYCYRGAKTQPMPNPHLTASSIKGFARKTGSETMVTNARWMRGCELGQATCVHHHPYPIYLLTRCHLSLSAYGGRKKCRPAAWHFVTVGHKGGQQQGKAPHCAYTTAYEGEPSKYIYMCVCVCV